MLRLFRNNNPLLLVVSLLYVVILRLVIFIYPENTDSTVWVNPLSELINRITGFSLYQEYINDTLSILLVFLSGLMLSYLINQYRLIDRAGYMPALIFFLSASFINEFCEFTPALCGFYFLQFAFITMVGMYKTQKAGGHMFNAGFFVGVAALFYLPYLSFITFLMGGYLLSRPFVFRELFNGLLGILIPLYFAGVVYFLNDSFSAFQYSLMALYDIQHVNQARAALFPLVVRLGSLLFLFILASLAVRRNYNKMVMQNRIIMTLCFVFFFSGIFSTLFIRDNNMSHYIWLSLPFTIIVSIFLAEFKKPWIAEIIHLCLLLLTFYFQYLY